MLKKSFIIIAIGIAVGTGVLIIIIDDSNHRRNERPLSRISGTYGIVLGNEIHECPKGTAENNGLISSISNDMIVRLAGDGTWAIRVPKWAWGQPADDASRIIVIANNESIEVNGLRFLEFVGVSHFLASDSNYSLWLISKKGTRLAVSAPVAASPGGRIARYDSVSGRIAVFASEAGFRNGQPILERQVQLDAATSIVRIRWLGDHHMAIEIGTEGGSASSVQFVNVESV